MRRIAKLHRRTNDHGIATHLYGIRNGLAHGKSRFILDRSTDLEEIAHDLIVVKLLARMVVEKAP